MEDVKFFVTMSTDFPRVASTVSSKTQETDQKLIFNGDFVFFNG